MGTDPTKTTWTDERGYERGVCLCGMEPSTQGSDSYGGLDFCADCGRNTCAQCRASRNGASICTKCSRPKTKRAGKRKRTHAARSKPGRAKSGRRRILGRAHKRRAAHSARTGLKRLDSSEIRSIVNIVGAAARENACTMVPREADGFVDDGSEAFHKAFVASARDIRDYLQSPRVHREYGAPRPLTSKEADAILKKVL